jgi:hypothetical protein
MNRYEVGLVLAPGAQAHPIWRGGVFCFTLQQDVRTSPGGIGVNTLTVVDAT